MKKYVSIFLALMLSLSMVACGEKDAEEITQATNSDTTISTEVNSDDIEITRSKLKDGRYQERP